FPHPPDKRLQHPRARAPCDVETRHRVAVGAREPPASFRPADDGEKLDTPLDEPGTLLPGRERYIRFRPPARPVVFLPVETRRTQPVVPGQFIRVANS